MEISAPHGAAPVSPEHPFADVAALDALQLEINEERPPGVTVPPRVDPAQHEGEARMLVGFALDLIGAKVGCTFDAATKADGASKLAPVLAKYGGIMPPWLAPYQDELKFGIWFAGVAFQVYATVQAQRAHVSPAAADVAAASAPAA